LTYVSEVLLKILDYKKTGIYQLSGKHDLSYVNMAKKILENLSLSGNISSCSSLEKGIKPLRYGSLQSYSPADFILNNEPFEHVLTKIFSEYDILRCEGVNGKN
jgi:dTDP-4-dehydrorhamnose reductase